MTSPDTQIHLWLENEPMHAACNLGSMHPEATDRQAVTFHLVAPSIHVQEPLGVQGSLTPVHRWATRDGKMLHAAMLQANQMTVLVA